MSLTNESRTKQRHH